ncbi:MAG TPA: HEAT repeat domain-containing protein [Clostridiaceae bacterium]|nr:HEAT repeat domain-containing protein [Clostridiaceae bacterium]
MFFISKEKKIESWAKKKNSEALAKLVTDSNVDIRVKVVNALSEIGDYRAVTALITALKDSDAKVRMAALDAFIKVKDQRGKEHIRYIIEHDPVAEVKEKAVKALSVLAGKGL